MELSTKVYLMLLVLLIIMQNSTNGQSDNSYKVVTIQEINGLAAQKAAIIDSSYQVDYNKALVTTFKDGTATIFPGNGGGDGLLFYDLKAMKKMIKERTFPVRGDGSFWEQEKMRVLDFYHSLDYYCSKLSEFLQFEVHISNDQTYLKQLSQIINLKASSNNNNDNLIRFLAIYIGEIIRQRVNGKWMLFPIYTLNTYYIPEIVYDRTYCSHWSYVINQLEMVSFIPIDLEGLIEKASTFVPFKNRNYVAISF